MVFSDPAFLYLFLPAVLVLYAALGSGLRNAVLLAASLLFYGLGEGWFLLVLLASAGLNYLGALWIARGHGGGPGSTARTAWVVGLNLLFLGVFKYADFAVGSVSPLAEALGLSALPLPEVHLPIGVSFFTFQALSYVLDVHRGEVPPERDPLRVFLYISLFPQLVAGPIVRYTTIASEIAGRRTTLRSFSGGASRFVVGLAKKVLVADTVGAVADGVFGLPPGQWNGPVAWAGLACYTIQIYYDFSGYSDMAIGLGRIFGFHFLENFQWPYSAATVTEFWRRWHISLSTWFRDYLYIPLGGSRTGQARTAWNLLVVFLLCGLWHGAAWNFVVWGAFHGAFLGMEKLTGLARGGQGMKVLGRPYVLAVAMAGWVLFRAESLGDAGRYFSALAGLAAGSGRNAAEFLSPDVLAALAAGAIGSYPVIPALRGAMASHARACRPGPARSLRAGIRWVTFCAVVALLGASLMQVALGTYSPFIYFRF